MASASAGQADTFPKLLLRNARERGGRVAFRHKDLGIWQSWTWAEVTEQVRGGRSILGLYPATDPQTLTDFSEWRKKSGR